MKSVRTLLPLALLLLCATLRLHAQDGFGGCTDSPENPTLVLGLIVGAAGLAWPRVRVFRRKRSQRGDQ